jgi:hypothetical protein
MILRNEPGSSGIQEALKDEHVQKIVDSLAQIKERDKIFLSSLHVFCKRIVVSHQKVLLNN